MIQAAEFQAHHQEHRYVERPRDVGHRFAGADRGVPAAGAFDQEQLKVRGEPARRGGDHSYIYVPVRPLGRDMRGYGIGQAVRIQPFIGHVLAGNICDYGGICVDQAPIAPICASRHGLHARDPQAGGAAGGQ